jgi:dTDP-4-dehydrorhamnose 3,5-epimerase
VLEGCADDDSSGYLVKSELLPFRGAVILRSEPRIDERGSFRRIVDVEDLVALGLESTIAQVSCVTNKGRGTIRGLHYQADPHGEAKTLWCVAGSVFDVIVDVRVEEPTYGKWLSIELSADEPVALHVPRGVAHGYQTLEDNTELMYLISAPYHYASARSLLWRDPTIGVEWPRPVNAISERDREAPQWPPGP